MCHHLVYISKWYFDLLFRRTLLCRDWYSYTQKWCRNIVHERRYMIYKKKKIFVTFDFFSSPKIESLLHSYMYNRMFFTNCLIWIHLWIGIGSVHARTGDILAYLYTWTRTFISSPSTLAVLTLTFSQYFLSGIMDGKLSAFDFYSCCTSICIFRLWTSRRTC
jgi:hypothetical protein